MNIIKFLCISIICITIALHGSTIAKAQSFENLFGAVLNEVVKQATKPDDKQQIGKLNIDCSFINKLPTKNSFRSAFTDHLRAGRIDTIFLGKPISKWTVSNLDELDRTYAKCYRRHSPSMAEFASSNFSEAVQEAKPYVARYQNAVKEAKRTEEQRLINRTKEIQTALSRLNYYKNEIDGISGPGTRSAIKAWEEEFFQTADGFLTDDEFSLLKEVSKSGFSSYMEWKSAQKLGFKNRQELERAHSSGFENSTEYENAKYAGVETSAEYAEIKKAGFSDKATYEAAKNRGYKNYDDYHKGFIKGNFSTYIEYVEAKTLGFTKDKGVLPRFCGHFKEA